MINQKKIGGIRIWDKHSLLYNSIWLYSASFDYTVVRSMRGVANVWEGNVARRFGHFRTAYISGTICQ